jgi:hypothetical protein
MVELEAIPQPARERLEQVGATELVIGILAPSRQGELNGLLPVVHEAIRTLSPRVRTVVIHDESPADQRSGVPERNDGLRVLPYPLFAPETQVDVQGISGAYRALFTVSETLGANACTIVAADSKTVTPLWISRLFQPVLDLNFDLVTPCYTHQKFEGLLNSSIVSPLTRALYGKQIQHPMGPDFAFSGRLLHRLLGGESKVQTAGRARSLVSLVTEAVEGFEVCQAYVGVRNYPPGDWTNPSSILAQVLGPLFYEVERKAALWQRIRGSQPVPIFGEGASMSYETGSYETGSEETGSIDTRRMIESFQLGCRSLQEIWGIVLPPTTLLELGKLARAAPDQFRMPDQLWARIIYDFALGYHLRGISQDHLLRAMTPLYLAWVASYALELENAGPAAVEQRLERLAVAYESAKPYFLSRWRWPDRFNP